MPSRTLGPRERPASPRANRPAPAEPARQQATSKLRRAAAKGSGATPAKPVEPSEAFAELRRLLARLAPRLAVVTDEPDLYHLNSRAAGPDGKPLFFAAVRRGKTYVSLHLMPIYTHPELLDGLDAELRRRMQGKSCFNFRAVDALTSRRLAELAERGFDVWKRAGWV